MQMQISREEARREADRKWLKEIANDILPFVILRKQLVELRDQIIKEDKAQTSNAVQTTLHSSYAQIRLQGLFENLGIEDPDVLTSKVIESLTDSFGINETEPILYLSKREHLDLTSKISTLLAFDTNKIRDTTLAIDESLKITKRIRKKLEKSDTSGADNFFAIKEQLLQKKQEQLLHLVESERKVDQAAVKVHEVAASMKAAQKQYEDFLKARSVRDTTATAILAFTDLQKRLYKKYITDVEKGFEESFHALINKSDLIDGIVIDEQLQVFPYKSQTFKRNELKETIQRMGDAYFISHLGSIAYDAYLEVSGENSDDVTLPVEVKQQLSAGEKQVFIMALYQALSKLNKVSVPYLIDTPFARIDNEHRQNILKNFFMHLKGQIIILSTDEEIVGTHKTSIEDTISDYYLLQHTENNGTAIIESAYFGGSADGK